MVVLPQPRSVHIHNRLVDLDHGDVVIQGDVSGINPIRVRNKLAKFARNPARHCLTHLYLNSYSYHRGRLKAVAQKNTIMDCTTPELRMLKKHPPRPPIVLISRYLQILSCWLRILGFVSDFGSASKEKDEEDRNGFCHSCTVLPLSFIYVWAATTAAKPISGPHSFVSASSSKQWKIVEQLNVPVQQTQPMSSVPDQGLQVWQTLC